MQYDPKLKKAMEQIKTILNENDINGAIILHSPGYSEFLNKIDASYSCAKFVGDALVIKANIDRDFNGDKKAWKESVEATINMCSHFEEVSAMMFMNYESALAQIKKQIPFDSTGSGFSSHSQQNN